MHGHDHELVARALNAMGNVVREQGDLAAAQELCEEALRIDTAVLGTNHRNTAHDLMSLAEVLRERGENTRARECLEHALQIYTRVLGEAHPDTLTAQDALSSMAGEQCADVMHPAVRSILTSVRPQWLGCSYRGAFGCRIGAHALTYHRAISRCTPPKWGVAPPIRFMLTAPMLSR